ncbi:hypothetical protein NPIL_234331, partial [Nephila pilipes]
HLPSSATGSPLWKIKNVVKCAQKLFAVSTPNEMRYMPCMYDTCHLEKSPYRKHLQNSIKNISFLFRSFFP